MYVWLYAMQVTGWSAMILCHKSPQQEGWNKRKLYQINLEKKKKYSCCNKEGERKKERKKERTKEREINCCNKQGERKKIPLNKFYLCGS